MAAVMAEIATTAVIAGIGSGGYHPEKLQISVFFATFVKIP